MTTYPQGPETGVKYTLIGPDGTTAVFNDPTDGNYVGSLTEITGLDSPDQRESAGDLVEADGGWHGNFFASRRPVTLAGTVIASSPTDRNAKMSKIRRASFALRSDASLIWTPTGGVSSTLSLRRQQPTRFSGGFTKDYFLALVAANPRIQSTTANSSGPVAHNTNYSVDNQGDTANFPSISITGPGTTFTVTNVLTGESIVIAATLSAGQSMTIDPLNKTVVRNDGTDLYQYVTFASTTWWELLPGAQNVKFTCASGNTAATLMTVSWRHAWM